MTNKNIEKEQVIHLSSAVDYKEGGIARKELLHSETGCIILIAFDAGQEFGKHTAAFEVMLQNLEGEGDIMIEGNWYKLKAGDVITIPKNAVHAVKAVTRFKMLLTRI